MINANDPKNSVRALLTTIVDYAGLFPPSHLPMAAAVANYAAYQKSDYRWMLGRFVVPVGRLAEFTESAKNFYADAPEIWRLSVLASEDVGETVRQIEDFNGQSAAHAVCDALEVKAETADRIKEIHEIVPPSLKTYFEIPIGENLTDAVAALAVAGRCAKIRAGGTTADAFPPIEKIARFMRVCLAANVPFKATAGLHHPLRAVKPLTYEPDAPEAAMNGFLNVFLAAAFLQQDCPPDAINELLKDRRADNFVFTDTGVWWRHEHFVSTSQLENLRARAAISFGSCSFVEPVEDLQEIGLL